MLSLAIRHTLGDFRLDAAFETGAEGVTALFGPSGAGKTTIVNAIAGLIRPQSGRIAIGETVLSDTESGLFVPARKRRVGYVFQDARLFPHMSVQANLMFGARRAQEPPDAAQTGHVVDLLGLGGLLERRPRRLSGGERQRVALARALLCNPRILLLDEPLAALDQARREEIIPYLERLRETAGIPIVYVSHSLDEVARLADHMVVLHDGGVAAQGSIFEVMARLDPGPVTGGADAGAVIEGTVASHAPQDGLTGIALGGGTLWIPLVSAPEGAPVRLRIRARDVMLALKKPAGISANNIVRGQVTAMAQRAGALVDVQLDCGGTLLTARVTRRSARRMKIAPGLRLHAVIKSVIVDRARLAGV